MIAVETDVAFQMLDLAADSPEVAAEKLFAVLFELGASDLFLCSNEQHVLALVRHLGIMRPIAVLMPDHGRRLITLFKIRASLDIAERRRPQDGRWFYVHDDAAQTHFDIRVSSIPTAYGEDLALRIFDRTSKLRDLPVLGLTRQQHQSLVAALDAPGGLILFTGPTGSGKTATLYACLHKLNDGHKKINTIEDPIEYSLDSIRQSQINPAIDLGFSELLRSVMRQSPDVIMIGEIRDTETAAIAIRAANSGHLVLATIHAASAAGAFQSMRALGVHQHFLASALRCVVAQRLVRTLCVKCRHSFDLADAPHTFDEVAHLLAPDEGKLLWSPRRCPACHHTGYDARTGIFELMPITRPIRTLIADNASTREIRLRAVEEKMLEFRHAALLKVANGVTSIEEVFRSVPSENLLAEQ
ncbi:MAG: GspE/PulE family protein [Phycisphaerales bacterium]|nr:GspE/PulE family protein [Phycisphaerales bacterium]